VYFFVFLICGYRCLCFVVFGVRVVAEFARGTVVAAVMLKEVAEVFFLPAFVVDFGGEVVLGIACFGMGDDAVWADVRAAVIADIASVGLLDDRAVLACEGAVFIAEQRGVCFVKGHRVVERGGAEATGVAFIRGGKRGTVFVRHDGIGNPRGGLSWGWQRCQRVAARGGRSRLEGGLNQNFCGLFVVV
jgi:hypothetical protein